MKTERINYCNKIAQTRLVVMALVLLAISASCTQTEFVAPPPTVVTISGATSMHPVLEALIAEFTVQHPGYLIDLRGGGSTIGEAQVREGRLRLAASTLLQNGIAENGDNEDGVGIAASDATLVRTPIGVDAVAVIVNQRNPVTELTANQLQQVYNGRILNWSELGGDEGSIVLVSREDGSGSRVAFESRIMGDVSVSLTAIVMPTSKDVVEYVTNNPLAIGYVSDAYLRSANEPLAGSNESVETADVIPLAIDGVLPSDASILDQSYPIVQPLFLITNGAPVGWAKEFVDYALSPAGQETVDRFHAPVR